MFSTTISGALKGVEGILLQIEVDVSNGLPCLEMVGLLGSEVKEAKERVRAAIKNLGITLPPKRIVVNLSPANVRKVGTAYDLPIAIGILKSIGVLPIDCTEKMLLLGELGLDGSIKPVTGVLPILKRANDEGVMMCILSEENTKEACFFPKMQVFGFESLKKLLYYLQKKETISPCHFADNRQEVMRKGPCFEEIIGQQSGKRAALISAAGGHNLLYIGAPGTGKTMLIKAMPSILPPLSEEEKLQVASIQSAIGGYTDTASFQVERPFVEVHHSATTAALLGGGIIPKAGAITMAHKGVLFLDELPEFRRTVLDAMRQPLEEKQISFMRSGLAYTFPADIMLVAAMNPCPCGHYPDKNKCICLPHQVRKYVGHISGPILDRIDVVAETVSMESAHRQQEKSYKEAVTSETMRKQVEMARKLQEERYRSVFGKQEEFKCNGSLSSAEIEKICSLDAKAEKFFNRLWQKFSMSGRGCYSLLKVARTIADLEESESVGEGHLAEAAGYRLGFERYFYG